MRYNSYDKLTYTTLNPALISSLKDVVKGVSLIDCDDDITYRVLYNQDSSLKPSILYGSSTIITRI